MAEKGQPSAAGPHAASSSNAEATRDNAGPSQEHDKLLEAYYSESKGKPTRMVAFEAYAALNETEGWLEDIESRAVSKMETASNERAKRAVKMNARREVLMEKWEAASEEEKAEVLAHIEEAYDTEMEEYKRSVMCEPKTVQEAVKYALHLSNPR